MTRQQCTAVAAAAQPFVDACIAKVAAVPPADRPREWVLFIAPDGPPAEYMNMAVELAGADPSQPYFMGFPVVTHDALPSGGWHFAHLAMPTDGPRC